MEQVAKILERIKQSVSNTGQFYDAEKYAQRRCDSYNELEGNLTGYDCPICKNKGSVMLIRDGYEIIRECDCMPIRQSIAMIERSGLKQLLQEYTFDKYEASEPWQRRAKEMAMRFVNDNNGKWFYMGGQVGSGKTHLCTAIVGELLKRGMPSKYMLWRDEVIFLKASVMDEYAYNKAISALKTIKVLYIDDFFKTEHGKMPTTAEINIAFELLNYRYNNPNLVTIISSEKLMLDLIDIDEAVGSRIYQRTKEYCLNIGFDRAKNYRLKG